MQLKSIWIWVFGVALSIWKLSIKYNFDKKINKMIQTRIHEYISEYIKRIFTIHMSILKWKMAVPWWQATAPHPFPFPCALALPPRTNHRNTTTPSPCWAPHFITRERLMFSYPTQSGPRLSYPTMVSDDMLLVGSHSALTLRLYLAACNPSSLCRFSSLNHLCSKLFEPRAIVVPFYCCLITATQSLNPCVCLYPFLRLFCLCFSDASGLQLWVLNCNFWSLSPQQFHHYFWYRTVSWQYQIYWTILIL